MIGINDAYSLPIFNPFIKSYRFKLLEKMVLAQKPQHHLNMELSREVNELIKKGASSVDVVKILLNKHNMLVRERSIQKRIKKLRITGELNYD